MAKSKNFRRVWVSEVWSSRGEEEYRLLIGDLQPDLTEELQRKTSITPVRVFDVELIMSKKITEKMRDLLDRLLKAKKRK